jgi:hypothetical protein
MSQGWMPVERQERILYLRCKALVLYQCTSASSKGPRPQDLQCGGEHRCRARTRVAGSCPEATGKQKSTLLKVFHGLSRWPMSRRCQGPASVCATRARRILVSCTPPYKDDKRQRRIIWELITELDGAGPACSPLAERMAQFRTGRIAWCVVPVSAPYEM